MKIQILNKWNQFQNITSCLIILFSLYSFSTLTHAASITVNSVTDIVSNNGDCTLREAILAANTDTAIDNCIAGSGADSITIGSNTINLINDLPIITEGLSLYGNPSHINGQDSHRIFQFDSSSLTVDPVFSLTNITIQDGFSTVRSGAITINKGNFLYMERVIVADNTSAAGGGIYLENAANESERAGLHMRFSNIADNIATGPASGGGIRMGNGSSALILHSSIVRNKATHINGNGGGIYARAGIGMDTQLQVLNTTIYLNTAANDGGGISLGGSTTATARMIISNSTISSNIANIDLGIGINQGRGGGLHISSNTTMSIDRSIVTGNIHGFLELDDIYSESSSASPAEITNNGFNLISVNRYVENFFPAGQPNANRDLVGTQASPLNSAVMLGPLTFDGGNTHTEYRPLLEGSIAIDAAGQCGVERDQVLQSRSKCKCDIGAYEVPEADPDNSSCEISTFVIPLENGKVITFDM